MLLTPSAVFPVSPRRPLEVFFHSKGVFTAPFQYLGAPSTGIKPPFSLRPCRMFCLANVPPSLRARFRHMTGGRLAAGATREDYATIDNAEVLDDVFVDGSCTLIPQTVPAGWRLADWDAGVAFVSP